MGSVGSSKLTEAIKAYTAQGGQLAAKYPFTPDKKELLLRKISDNEFITTKDIYRKIDLSEKDRNDLFSKLYDDEEIEVKFNTFQSFTKDEVRAQVYGGKQLQYIIYKIPKGTKVRGMDIQSKSVYPEEQEILLGKGNSFISRYSELGWKRGNMVLTLRNKR